MLGKNRQEGTQILNASLHGGVKFADLLKEYERGMYPFEVRVLKGRDTLTKHGSCEASYRFLTDTYVVKARAQFERHFNEAEVAAILEGRAKIVARDMTAVQQSKKSEIRSGKKSLQLAAAA